MEKPAAAAEKTEEQRTRDELHLMKTAGIIEVAVRNPSVAEYMEHWEGRATKAEAEEQMLTACLREAVSALYGCRYSEQPLAKKLDGVLKQITGKSQADLALEWAYAQANKPTASSLPAE
jgi:hypothetical protein